MTAHTPPSVLVKEEIIDDFVCKINGKPIGIDWRYSIWECTDADGNKHWIEKSHGTCMLYFFSIPLIGDTRILSSAPDPVCNRQDERGFDPG